MSTSPLVVQREPSFEMPEALHRAAFIVKNGERLWQADDAIEAVRWLAARSFAIIGVEMYARHGIGWGTYKGEWSASHLDRSEAWQSFVERTAAGAIAFLVREGRRAPSGPLYFLAACRQDEVRSTSHSGHGRGS